MDADYRKRLKRRLKNDAPPFLFGADNPQLLNNSGIAVVGSQIVSEENLQCNYSAKKEIELGNCSCIA